MRTLALLVAACFPLAACNAPAPQASAPPTPGSVAVTPAGFQLPEGMDCSAKIARYRAVQDNDLSMGHVAQSVYEQIKRDTDAASNVCAAGPRRRGQGDGGGFTKASRLPDGSLSKCVAQIIGDENRHPRLVDVLRTTHDVDARKFRQRVSREERFYPRLEPGGRQRERHELHASDARRRDGQSPASRDVRFGGEEPRLFEQFPAARWPRD